VIEDFAASTPLINRVQTIDLPSEIEFSKLDEGDASG
jgi:hypothetical protein